MNQILKILRNKIRNLISIKLDKIPNRNKTRNRNYNMKKNKRLNLEKRKFNFDFFYNKTFLVLILIFNTVKYDTKKNTYIYKKIN